MAANQQPSSSITAASLVNPLTISLESLSDPELREELARLSGRRADADGNLSRADLIARIEAFRAEDSQREVSGVNVTAQQRAADGIIDPTEFGPPLSSLTSSSSSLSTSSSSSSSTSTSTSTATSSSSSRAFPSLAWVLGPSGMFGTIFFASYKGRDVALKAFSIPRTATTAERESYWRGVRKEILILQVVARNHPNLCGIVGLTRHPEDGSPIVVMWRMATTVQQFFRAHPNAPFHTRLRMVHDAAVGLLWLHDRPSPVLHLDMKLPNMLMDAHDTVVLCDFGLSVVMDQGRTIKISDSDTGAKKGNISHRAPELFRSSVVFGTPVDVYSFAICAWEIFTGQEWDGQVVLNAMAARGLSAGVDMRQSFAQAVVNRHFRPPFPQEWPQELLTLLQQAWHPDPKLRPTMKELVGALQPGGAIDRAFRQNEEALQKERIYGLIAGRLSFDPLAFQIALDAFSESPCIPWDKFARTFWSKFHPVLKEHGRRLQENELPALRYALHVDKASETVHFDDFCKVVDSFWPLNDYFLTHITEVLSFPFVRLHWNGDKTMAELHGRGNGTFLFRFSEKSGAAFTLTIIKGDKKLSAGHQVCVRIRVYREVDADGNPYYRLGHRSFPTQTFESLEEIVDGDVGRSLGLERSISEVDWMPPMSRFSLPAPVDTTAGRPSSSHSGQPRAWRDMSTEDAEHYQFFNQEIFEHSLRELTPSEAIHRAIDPTRPMSPDRDRDQ